MVKKIKLINKKYFDSLRSSLAISEGTTWASAEADPATLNTLFAPVPGTDINQRVGRRVEVTNVTVRGTVDESTAADQADSLVSGTVRLILVLDKETNSVQLNSEDVMTSPATASTALVNSSFMSTAFLGRFEILDEVFLRGRDYNSMTDGTNTSSQAAPQRPFVLEHTFDPPLTIHFNSGSAGSVADIVDNSFHLLAHSATTANTTNLSYNCRTCYYDY